MLLKARLKKITVGAAIVLTSLSYISSAKAEPGASDLGALENEALEIVGPIDPLTTIAKDINHNLTSLSEEAESSFIDLSTMPIIRDFVNEEGDVALPLHQSVSIEVVDSFGDYGVGLGTRF